MISVNGGVDPHVLALPKEVIPEETCEKMRRRFSLMTLDERRAYTAPAIKRLKDYHRKVKARWRGCPCPRKHCMSRWLSQRGWPTEFIGLFIGASN
jgi:hypothetical protein